MALLQWFKLVQSIVSTFLKEVKWLAEYCHAVTQLACAGHISWATWRYALATQPVAVAGPEGGWVVDPDFK